MEQLRSGVVKLHHKQHRFEKKPSLRYKPQLPILQTNLCLLTLGDKDTAGKKLRGEERKHSHPADRKEEQSPFPVHSGLLCTIVPLALLWPMGVSGLTLTHPPCSATGTRQQDPTRPAPLLLQGSSPLTISHSCEAIGMSTDDRWHCSSHILLQLSAVKR